jgi:hypothetical protein
LVFDETFDDPRLARRSFNRVARNGDRVILVDVRNALPLSSAAWASIVAGVRSLAYSGRNVTVFAGVGLRLLLELSSLSHVARIIVSDDPQAA